jgi:hypothetical protein
LRIGSGADGLASKSKVLRPQNPEKSGTLSAAETGATSADIANAMAPRQEHCPTKTGMARSRFAIVILHGCADISDTRIQGFSAIW